MLTPHVIIEYLSFYRIKISVYVFCCVVCCQIGN